jgi:collagenase-like PrtC family protease
MPIAIGTNFSKQLVEALEALPLVTDLYGCMPRHVVGHVRPYPNMPDLTKEQAGAHIRAVQATGRTFTYLLNSPSLGGRQFDSRRSEVRKHLDWVAEVGADYVALAIPDLFPLVKKHYPQLKIKASHMTFINTVEQARMYEDLGADLITPHASINRQFKLLGAVRDAVSVPIQIIVTGLCARGCPNRVSYHACATAMLSSGMVEANQHNRHATGYCFSFCHLKKLERPELIMMGGVRPEDIHHYEKIGVTHFKVDSRVLTTEQIVDRATAWHNQKWEGDLKRLMSVFSLGYRTWAGTQMGGGDESRPAPEEQRLNDPSQVYYSVGHTIDFDRLLVDNPAMDGVFRPFLNEDCPPACKGCNKCAEVATRAIQFDPVVKEKFMELLKEYRRWLLNR